ncbi:hypothetical protein VOLCADRAFT_120965 [Volvox carteri f. nagariensis]|uniref:BTB domain-containing protein n=1 Tax=Volvox carteri f. nagariensis TaxID=3068 RepID=D8TY75_VOLCA|nr:uncharacterized protein VOLCADRAFT_120965 [Volvox carteri f. nagariensis]EFJ47596.1 hypothetical protein VOLCADRAFT_120965 [Volvox carteri f. nagariensis]|eukprot:XP_002951420.1 hypothetical protein VOLCADRAFT_120965 [Volvox carteri f. nagariensis]
MSVSSRLLSLAASEELQAKGRPPRTKRYGAKFATGFLEFYRQSEMADCTVVGPDGREYQLHGLLLAYHSEFFRRALSSEFKEGQARRIVLRFEDSGNTWSALIEYFYTEEILLTDANVLALFAASRELMIPAIQDFCADFAQSSLDSSNAIQFLSQAVQYNCDQFRSSCVALVAQSFNTCCFKPTDGLPVEVMLEILDHPQLYVQTEEQVLLFVQNYVRRHQLDADTIRALYRTVRLPFLSNERLAALTLGSVCGDGGIRGLGKGGDGTDGRVDASGVVVAVAAGGPMGQGPPKDLLLAAMAQRLCWIDHPERLPPAAGGGVGGGGLGGGSAPGDSSDSGGGGSGNGTGTGTGASRMLGGLLGFANGASDINGDMAGVTAPRKTYCCSIEYGLPGGSEYVSIPMEAVWDDLAANLTVRVSGETEGDPDSILRTLDDPASWFNVTGDDPLRPVWVEVVFPPHMRVVELTKYTFSHGMNMSAHMFPYGISDSSWFQMKGMCTQVVWRRLRIVAGEDGSQQVRLSIRRLKLYGRVEVSLLREPDGRDVVAAWRRRKEADTELVWQRPALTPDELALLEKSASSDGLYSIRVKTDRGTLLSSVPAKCLLLDNLKEQVELQAGHDGFIESFNYGVESCSSAGAPGAAASGGGGGGIPDGSGTGVGPRPDRLPVQVKVPAQGPTLLMPEVLGEFSDVYVDATEAGSVGAAAYDPNAKPRTLPSGGAGGQAGARRGGPPPKDERTWLQKNWLYVVAIGMMVLNVVAKANVPPPQQGGPGAAPGGGGGGAARRS